MQTIIAELTANNQVAIRYVFRPNCLKGKEAGDLSRQKDAHQIAKCKVTVEGINKVIKNARIEYSHENIRIHEVEQAQILSEPMYANIKTDVIIEKNYYLACKVPQEYALVVENAGMLIESKTTHIELLKEWNALLDIIKKSQQGKKYERPWGKPQPLRRFTLNAKQKILECGAVVDKYVGNTNSYELTLTIPGSGFSVYRAVSAWSGYIVNRLTQIIRRAEAKGVPVHWFFVWEHQKRGALHMHWCIGVVDNPKAANLLALEIRAKWFALLEELSVKMSMDLFKKRGFSGTWRHSPEKWQYSISRIRKSVAAYFSKYLGKTYDTSRDNLRRRKAKAKQRKWDSDLVYRAGASTLCPSRYWGCGYRVKRLCADYRVTVPFVVFSREEGTFVAEAIRGWINDLSSSCKEVSRSFEKACPKSGFIFASGWESKIWFDAQSLDAVLMMFKRLKAFEQRKTDAIGAIAAMMDW